MNWPILTILISSLLWSTALARPKVDDAAYYDEDEDDTSNIGSRFAVANANSANSPPSYSALEQGGIIVEPVPAAAEADGANIIANASSAAPSSSLADDSKPVAAAAVASANAPTLATEVADAFSAGGSSPSESEDSSIPANVDKRGASAQLFVADDSNLQQVAEESVGVAPGMDIDLEKRSLEENALPAVALTDEDGAEGRSAPTNKRDSGPVDSDSVAPPQPRPRSSANSAPTVNTDNGASEKRDARDAAGASGPGANLKKRIIFGTSLTANRIRRKFPLVFCELERDNGIVCPGVRRGNFMDQFYYDSLANRCQHFVYNGCGGNGNRFSSLWECNMSCTKRQTGIISL